MSIFKSSFQSFVTKQIKLREAIVSQGNQIIGSSVSGRNKLTKTTLKELGLPENTPINSFFTYTTSRQCVIRMSSGVDLKEDATILADNKFERLRDLVGPGLATRYVLEGGIPVKNLDFIAREKDSSGNMKEIERDYAKYKHSTRGLHLKKGSFGKHYSATYGDPYIRSDAGDGYGIVPMPGITNATIRTKTAYGSLREAKVEFVVHNKRQLEVMELLYMRPGFPILIEWGWSMYIGNDGKKETYFPQIPDFWKEGSKTHLINSKILKNKALTSGNYDGFLGMCKNFEFQARKDGGFNCSTEIIGQGEIIESLKGKREGRTKTVKEGEFLERIEVDDFEYWLYALKLWCDRNSARAGNPPEDYIGDNPESIDLYGSLLEFVINKFDDQMKSNNDSFNLDLDEYRKAVEDAQNNVYNELASSIKGFNKNNTPAQNKKLVEDNMDFGSWSSGATDLKLDNFMRDTEGLSEDFETVERYLDELLIYKGESLHQDNTRAKAGTNYVRWDFLVEILNKHVIDTVGDSDTMANPQTMARITTRGSGNQDRDPLLYTKYEFKNVKTQTFKVLNEDGNSTDADIRQLIDMSVDPNIALLPHQIQKINNAELLEFDDDSKVKREIGRIYISLDFLNKTYTGMRYVEDGLNPDFSMFKFLKKIWDGISNSCAGLHKFVLQTEHERPDHVRVIDLGVATADIDPDRLHTLKVQSNQTIVRDFNFNSTIPNAMSSTIAIAAQNPDSISDLEATSFAALHTNIETRFFKPSNIATDKTKERKAAKYDNDLAKFKRNMSNLYTYKVKMLQGAFEEDDVEGDGTETNIISKNKAIAIVKALEGNLISLCSRYPKDDEENGEFFKGFRRKFFNQTKSEIIPLKFNAQLDGISGIIIGNVFKIDKTRLPEGYQGEDIAFVVMGENQKITAGQDWVTEISGQIILLDLNKNEGQIDEIEFGNTIYRQEITGGSPDAGFDPGGDQVKTVPGLLDLKDGDPVYLKIGDGPTFVRHNFSNADSSGDNLLEAGTMVMNETSRRNTDNVIGCFPGGGFYDQNKIDELSKSNLNFNPAVRANDADGYILADVGTFNLLKEDDPDGNYDVIRVNGKEPEDVAEGSRNQSDFEAKHWNYHVYEGEESIPYISEVLKDSNGNTIVADSDGESESYKQLLTIMLNSECPVAFCEPGMPVKVYKQTYKGLFLGWKRAQGLETRYKNTEKEYTTLWFQIEFTKYAWNIVNAFPWVMDGTPEEPTFFYYEYNNHIRVRYGYKDDPSKVLLDADGEKTDGAYIGLIPITQEEGEVLDYVGHQQSEKFETFNADPGQDGPFGTSEYVFSGFGGIVPVGNDADRVIKYENSYMDPSDPRYGTPIVRTKFLITKIDKNGANRGPEFEADGRVGKRQEDEVARPWFDASSNTGGLGWMEVSVLDVGPDEATIETDKNSFSTAKLQPGLVITRETTVEQLLNEGSPSSLNAIKAMGGRDQVGSSNGNMGYEYHSSNPLNAFSGEHQLSDPAAAIYYPWWISYKKGLVPTSEGDRHWDWIGKIDNNNITRPGHVAQSAVDFLETVPTNPESKQLFFDCMSRLMKSKFDGAAHTFHSAGIIFDVYSDEFGQFGYREEGGKTVNFFGEEVRVLGPVDDGGTGQYVDEDAFNEGYTYNLLAVFNETEFRKMTLSQVHVWHALCNALWMRGKGHAACGIKDLAGRYKYSYGNIFSSFAHVRTGT